MSDLLTAAELDELSELEASMASAPWCVGALYGGIRHVQRNTELFEDCLEEAEGDDQGNTPDRYDGTALAKLRNALPRLIETARAAHKK